jgi:ACS family sodium-dependent inorganic phosphate cotransporter
VKHRLPRKSSYITVVLLVCVAAFISGIDRTSISVAAIAMQGQLGWSETEKGTVLSAFFIGYILLMLVSGTLANRYGGKIVLGTAVLWWSLCTALTPQAALISLPALIAARIALGLGESAVFPASINMIGRWVPPLNRSRAVALLSSAIPLSTVFALPTTGWLVRDFGWPVPFYVFAALGCVWAIIWFTNVGDQPSVNANSPAARPSIPWARLLRLPAVWAIISNHLCHNWSLYVLLSWLPSYFKRTFDVTLASAGLLSAGPWLASFLMANVAGHIADRLMRAGRSATFVRKLMQTIGLGGAGIFLLQLPGAGSVTAALILTCCATGLLAVCFAGFAPNSFDIAPRYADVIWGLSNTFATIPGIVGVFLTGWLVDRTGSFATPFLVTAAVAFVGAILYLVLASGERLLE